MFSTWIRGIAALSVSLVMVGAQAQEAVKAPEVLIKEISDSVVEAVKSDKAIQGGDIQRITALVDQKVMPHVNFQRMTASSVGRPWREATPEQQKRLQEEFKTLLLRVYSGALTQVKANTTIQMVPSRAATEGNETVVRTEVRDRGEPVKLDYRLEKTAAGWKIYDVNVAGLWLVGTYQSSFKQELSKGGIDGLINSLVEKNKASASKG